MALNNLNNWTDGCIILLYINTNNLRFHTVFASHLSYIRGESEPLQRRNVNTKSYPSDCVNRGLRANKLIDNNLWLNGPMFLFNDESEWPGQLMYRRSMPNNDSKVKNKAKFAVQIPVEGDKTFQNFYSKYTTFDKKKLLHGFCEY